MNYLDFLRILSSSGIAFTKINIWVTWFSPKLGNSKSAYNSRLQHWGLCCESVIKVPMYNDIFLWYYSLFLWIWRHYRLIHLFMIKARKETFKNLNNSFCFVLFLAVKPQSKDGDENNSAASLTSMTFLLAISSIVAYLVLWT